MIISFLEIAQMLLLKKLERAKQKGKALKGLRAICSDKGQAAVAGIMDTYEKICEFVEEMDEQKEEAANA